MVYIKMVETQFNLYDGNIRHTLLDPCASNCVKFSLYFSLVLCTWSVAYSKLVLFSCAYFELPSFRPCQ